MTQSSSAPWWKKGIIYQIYPRSFMDSSGDGIGDLRGIADRLNYLDWLGIDGVWLSPIYPSPMADFGYDVADYVGVHETFGTLDDFDHLLSEAHAREMKIILDLVPNHTSSEHAWFKESCSSSDNPKRNWYIWRDAQPNGDPPNNWLGYFGGSSWCWNEASGQYYLHSFLKQQPDLNWHNPEVRKAIYDSIRFWLDRGVDGFRIDVIDRMIKDEQLRDNPLNPDYVEGRDNPTSKFLRVFSENRPGIHELITEFREVFDEYDDRVVIGEIAYSTDPGLITGFYGEGTQPFGTELHLPFNFALILLDWDAAPIKAFVDAYEAIMPPYGWPNYVVSNHDQTRIATRVGDAQARIAAMLILTLRGTPFIYYGDEIGMRDVDIPPEQYQDPQGINIGISRDPERTPMQWDDSANAGFAPAAAKTWLPVAPNYATEGVSVAAEKQDDHSMLTLYKRLIDLRRSNEALALGDYAQLDAQAGVPDGVYAYGRGFASGDQYVIALNFSDETKHAGFGGEIVLSTHLDRDGAVEALELRPNEGVLLRR